MGSRRSKEDDVNRISISIYVTNFPENFSAKELFQSCKQYGHVVDSFIPRKRTKEATLNKGQGADHKKVANSPRPNSGDSGSSNSYVNARHSGIMWELALGFSPKFAKPSFDINTLWDSLCGKKIERGFIYCLWGSGESCQTMGYNMDGVINNLSDIMKSQGASINLKRMWDQLDAVIKQRIIACSSTTKAFGNSGVDESKVVTGLPEEFQEGDMVDALSRVLEQQSSEKGVDSGGLNVDVFSTPLVAHRAEDRVTPSRFGGKKNGKPPRWDVDQKAREAAVPGYYLVDLEVNNAWLSIDNMNPMPMLKRLEDPRIHLHNLKTCHWTVPNHVFSLTLITPKLGTLRLEFQKSTGLHVESPMLSHLHIDIDSASSFEVTQFEKLKTVQLKSINIRSLLDKFPLIDKVENLTVESRNLPSGTDGNSSFTLYHVFRDFPA
ncbi:F-box/LRR-repeat protein-like protein [Tanacetum coccineum]